MPHVLVAGIRPAAARMARMPRGHPEALTDAWANLYTEAAIAVAARRNGETLPPDLLAFPTLADGLAGMRFIEAAIRSHAEGRWVAIDAA